MKSWFAKFRISAALDEKSVGDERRTLAAPTDDLQQFEQKLARLDSALRATRPQAELPPFLHARIMRTVELAAQPAAVGPRAMWPRWAFAPALALLVAFGLWAGWHSRHPGPKVAGAQSLVWVSTVLDARDQLAGSLPDALVAPLSQELENVHQDAGNTARFLLATLP